MAAPNTAPSQPASPGVATRLLIGLRPRRRGLHRLLGAPPADVLTAAPDAGAVVLAAEVAVSAAGIVRVLEVVMARAAAQGEAALIAGAEAGDHRREASAPRLLARLRRDDWAALHADLVQAARAGRRRIHGGRVRAVIYATEAGQ
jgi:hypothetical protein